MAIFYARLSTVCRAKGHSVVAAAAYRTGTRLLDERTETAHDFTRRRGVVSAGMLAPTGAEWALDLHRVWALAEKAEVRRNARTGRELVVALPVELTDAENAVLARRLGQDLVDAYGVAVLVAVHAPDARGDQRNRHVHLLFSTRAAAESGFGAKVRVLDDKTSGPVEAQAMRSRVAERINAALTRAGHAARVDPRTLAEQASDAADRADFAAVVALSRTPMRHQGRVATARARKGEGSVVVEENTRRAHGNAALFQWGTFRADQLRRAVAARGGRGAAAPRTVRRQELRNGLGPMGSIARAAGADADLLNAQARSREATARAERDAAEAYLDRLAREADRQAIAVRAYGVETSRLMRAVPTEHPMREARLPSGLLKKVEEAHAAFVRAEEEHEQRRRAKAQAEHATAVARRAAAEEDPQPPVWRPASKRQWAEHRRRQRASLAERLSIEEARGRQVAESASRLGETEARWCVAREELRETVRTAAENLRLSAREHSPKESLDAPATREEKPLDLPEKSVRRGRKWR